MKRSRQAGLWGVLLVVVCALAVPPAMGATPPTMEVVGKFGGKGKAVAVSDDTAGLRWVLHHPRLLPL